MLLQWVPVFQWFAWYFLKGFCRIKYFLLLLFFLWPHTIISVSPLTKSLRSDCSGLVVLTILFHMLWSFCCFLSWKCFCSKFPSCKSEAGDFVLDLTKTNNQLYRKDQKYHNSWTFIKWKNILLGADSNSPNFAVGKYAELLIDSTKQHKKITPKKKKTRKDARHHSKHDLKLAISYLKPSFSVGTGDLFSKALRMVGME